jgi:CRP-like cAMP-binding protein/molybdopterin/thiamine biosynthesis adenylyltransferase
MESFGQLPDHETFYRLLTSQQSGLVDADEQLRLRDATVLVVGCGVIGSRATEYLATSGVECFCFVDDRIVTQYHLARISRGFHSIGQNFVDLLVEDLKRINPFATCTSHNQPLQAVDFPRLIAAADLVIDALGIENVEDFRVRWSLHQAAQRAGVPVVTGFDIGSSVWTLVNDYRDDHLEVLSGTYGPADLEAREPTTAVPILLRMMSPSKSQPEVLRETERILLGQRDQLPRSAPASGLVGSLVSQAAIDLLLERPVRPVIAVDLEETIQPSGGLRRTGRRIAALYSLRRRLRHRRKEGRVGVFTPLEDEVFQALRPYMEERSYEAGSVVVRQGDGADEFFVIIDGRVDVEFEERDEHDEAQDYTVIAELGPGDYFGELALLTDTPRAASVVVAQRCRVLALSRGAFEIYLEESDTAASKVRGEALARFRENSTFIGC